MPLRSSRKNTRNRVRVFEKRISYEEVMDERSWAKNRKRARMHWRTWEVRQNKNELAHL